MFEILRQLQEGKAVLINKAIDELGGHTTETEIEQWSLVMPNGEWYNYQTPEMKELFAISPSKYMMLTRILFDKITNEPHSIENWVVRTKNKWIKQVMAHEKNTTKNTWIHFFKQLKEQAKAREEHDAYSIGMRSEVLAKLKEQIEAGTFHFTTE